MVTIIFYVKPLCDQCHNDISLSEKLIFLFFFVGAILCLGMSSLFHTVCCHSEDVSKLFNKLDYVGISLLTVGSFVPWIYYSFYCEFVPKLVYMIIISVLGVGTIAITMMDRFTTAAYRSDSPACVTYLPHHPHVQAGARPHVRQSGPVRCDPGVSSPPGLRLAHRLHRGRHAQGVHTGRPLHPG